MREGRPLVKPEIRPITEKERERATKLRLGDDARRYLRRELIRDSLVTLFVIPVIAFILLGWGHMFAGLDIQFRYVVAASVISGIIFAVWVFARRLKRNRAILAKCRIRSEAIRQDMEAGVVEVIRVQPIDVVQIEDPNNNQPRYCYRLDENTALLTCGSEDDPEPPNSDLELVHLPKSRVWLDITKHGRDMEPTSLLDYRCILLCPEAFEPFEVNWEEFVARKAKL